MGKNSFCYILFAKFGVLRQKFGVLRRKKNKQTNTVRIKLKKKKLIKLLTFFKKKIFEQVQINLIDICFKLTKKKNFCFSLFSRCLVELCYLKLFDISINYN